MRTTRWTALAARRRDTRHGWRRPYRSFFPDAPNVAELFAANPDRLVLPVESAAALENRVTLEGPDKKQVFERVLGREELPIRTAMEASVRPMQIFWAE